MSSSFKKIIIKSCIQNRCRLNWCNLSGILTNLLVGFVVYAGLQMPAAAESVNFVSAMQQTLLHNEDLLSKKSRLYSDAEQVNQAWAKVKPKISASVIKGRSEYSTSFAEDQKETFQRLNFNVVQPVYSRKLFLGIDRSEAEVESQQALFSLEQQTKLVEMGQAYIEVLKFQEAERISKMELTDHLQRIKQLEAMLERGLSNKVDLLEAQSRYDVLRSNLVRDQNDLKVAQKTLGRIVGFQVTQIESLNQDLWQRAKQIIGQTDWVTIALRNSQTIEVAKKRIAVSEANVKVAKAEYWPELSLRVTVGDSETYETSIQKDQKIQLELNVPLYEGGLTDSRLAAARYFVESENYFLEDQKRFIEFKMDEIMARLEGSIANIESLQKSKVSNEAYLDSAQKGLIYGLRGVFDVLEAKARGYQVERRMIFEIYDNIMAQIEFLHLIGQLSTAGVESYLQSDFSLSALQP